MSGTNPGIQASISAKKILVELHQKQFDKILGDEREKLGLPRDLGPSPKTKIENEIKVQERKLERLHKKLEKLS